MAIQFVPAPVAESPLDLQLPTLVLFGRNRSGKPCAAWFDGNQAEAATNVAVTMKLCVLPVGNDEQRVLALQLAHGRILPSGKAHVPGARRDLYGRLVALVGESAGLSITERPEERGEQARKPEPKADPAPAEGSATTKGGETVTKAASAAPAAVMPPASLAMEKVPVVAVAIAADMPAKPRPGDGLFVGEVKPTERDQIGLGSIVLAQEGPDEGWWEAEVIGCNGRVFSMRWRDYPVEPTILRKLGELALLPSGEA